MSVLQEVEELQIDKVREKLLALIQKAKDICANDYSDHTENEYIADMILDSGMVCEWIPVTERLPTEKDANVNGMVIAILKDNGYARGWVWTIVARHPQEFTHWMSMPALPKDGET